MLDNPIWNALNTGNRKMAYGIARVKYIDRDVGLFAGFEFENQSAEALDELSDLLPSKAQVVLFTTNEIVVPNTWHVKMKRALLQMVCRANGTMPQDKKDIVALREKDIEAMIALTHLTNPGPFYKGTIRFGNYEGIFVEGRLVAMTGQRLQPGNYSEVSAVCTHPDHAGKGYAARLLAHQLENIRSVGKVPFLHVYPGNTGAIRLYEKAGFTTRKEMLVYFIQRAA